MEDHYRFTYDKTLRRTNIPVPNKDLAKWLVGPELRAIVEEITDRVMVGYLNTAPVRVPRPSDKPNWPPPGHLRRGIYKKVGIGLGPKSDRWYGWVANSALSYRPQKNQPYPNFIEYGKPSKGKPGGHQLARAAARVARQLVSGGVAIPGVAAVPTGRGSRFRDVASGHFVQDRFARDARPSARKRPKRVRKTK